MRAFFVNMDVRERAEGEAFFTCWLGTQDAGWNQHESRENVHLVISGRFYKGTNSLPSANESPMVRETAFAVSSA
jgi:hypothetical protein